MQIPKTKKGIHSKISKYEKILKDEKKNILITCPWNMKNYGTKNRKNGWPILIMVIDVPNSGKEQFKFITSFNTHELGQSARNWWKRHLSF